jgi:hypothetical protein
MGRRLLLTRQSPTATAATHAARAKVCARDGGAGGQIKKNNALARAATMMMM